MSIRDRIEEDRRVTATHPRDGDGDGDGDGALWRRQRVLAGLSLRQAAKLLEAAPDMLADAEGNRWRLSEALLERMAACYCCGQTR